MDEQEIDLRKYIETLWKWRAVIILVTGVAVAISGVFSFFVLSPVYETKVTLLVSNAAANQQSVKQSGDGSIADTVSRMPTMTLNTYMNQLTSPYFLKTVVERHGLKDITPSQLGSMVKTQILKDTNLIDVRVENTDKELAAQIANAMAVEFVKFVSESSQERMTKSLVFLTEQKAGLLLELEEAYGRLEELQSGPDNVSSLTRLIASNGETLATFRADLARARVQESLLTAGIAQIEADLAQLGPKANETPSATHSELLKMRSQKAVQLVEITAQIAGLTREIPGMETLLTAMESRLSAAQNTESKAKAAVSRIEASLSLLETRVAETQMARSLDFGESTISVVSPALEPGAPVKPRKLVNMAVAGVLGGFVSVLMAFVLEYMDNTVKSQEDVTKHLGLGTLGAVPMTDPRGHGEPGHAAAGVYVNSRSALAEAFRTIRTSLNYTADRENTKVLLVTGAEAGDGKTMVSISLSKSLAEAGEKVLLIDADLRKPNCHRALSLDNQKGLTNVLAGSEDPSAVIRESEIPGLSVMTSGPIPPNPAELLGGVGFDRLLDSVKSGFGHVIIDSPPAGLLADASIIASRVDGIVLVAVSGATRVDVLREVKENLALAHGKIIGIVLNKVRYTNKRSRYKYYEYGSDDGEKDR